MAKRRFEFIDAKSFKFWEINTSGKKLTIRYGKIGTEGQTTLKELATPAEAKAQAEKLILEKTKKGYVEGDAVIDKNLLLTQNKEQRTKNLKFTISSRDGTGGDGAFLCYTKVTKKISDYFESNDLNLEDYALDEDYADENDIPEKMRPFSAGSRAEFGTSKSGMTATNYLEILIQTEENSIVFSGEIPQKNLITDEKLADVLERGQKGIYAVGYEGLEDCYISGELKLESDFDVKKLKILCQLVAYTVSDRKLITSVEYDKEQCDWDLDSYEGTGDNSFQFISVTDDSEKEDIKNLQTVAKKSFKEVNAGNQKGVTPMGRYFEFKDKESSKFWEITVVGKKVTIHYGKIGTAGQNTVKELATSAEANTHAEKVIGEKMKKGYKEKKK